MLEWEFIDTSATTHVFLLTLLEWECIDTSATTHVFVLTLRLQHVERFFRLTGRLVCGSVLGEHLHASLLLHYLIGRVSDRSERRHRPATWPALFDIRPNGKWCSVPVDRFQPITVQQRRRHAHVPSYLKDQSTKVDNNEHLVVGHDTTICEFSDKMPFSKRWTHI